MASIGTWKKCKIPRLQLASCFYLKVQICRFKVKENVGWGFSTLRADPTR